MKLILKNSSLVFQNSKYEVKVKTITGQYVTAGPRITTAPNFNINIFEVIEGCRYKIRTTPYQWEGHSVDFKFCILDSANCDSSNCGTLETFADHLLQTVGVWNSNITSITLDFVAEKTGYLYLNENTGYGTFTLESL